MRRLDRLLLLIVIIPALDGCVKAFSKMAYNNLLPQMVLSRIDNYFDLNPEQEKYLKARLIVHHNWHRTTQLGAYLSDLRELRKKFENRLTESDLNWLTARLTLHRNAIFARVIPDIVNILQTLSDDQISHLEKKLNQENKELAAKLARPLSVRQKEEFAVIVKQIEDWAGSFSDEQKARLQAKYAAIPASAVDWLKYREEQQAVWIALLRSKPDHQRLKDDLDGRMIYQEKNLPSRFKATFARTLTLMKEMILTADMLLTTQQRAHVLAKADEYIQLLSELAAPG